MANLSETIALDVLKRVRKLFNNKKHWTKGTYAKTKSGAVTTYQDAHATRWCLLGACYKIGDTKLGGADPNSKPGDIAAEYLLNHVSRDTVKFQSVWEFNDDPSTDIQAVRKFLDTNIARLEKAPQ